MALPASTSQAPAGDVAIVQLPATAPQLKALTGARALAALWVVFVHIESLHGVGGSSQAGDFIREFSVLPVVFFFVLSGFILSVVYLPRVDACGFAKSAQAKFGFARVARIVPLYVVSLIPGLIFGLAWLLAPGQSWPLMGDMRAGSAWLGVNGWGFNTFLRSNVPAWTLTAELIFYAMFPWFVSRALKWNRAKCLAVLYGSLAAYLFIQASLGIMQIAGPPSAAAIGRGLGHFGSPLFIPTFTAGVLLGVLHSRGWISGSLPARSGWIYGGLVIATILATQLAPGVLPPSLVPGLLAPIFCLVILAASGAGGRVNQVLSHPVMRSLGAASYAIYITHWPVKGVAEFYLGTTGLPGQVVGILTVFLVIAIGYLCHFWIEKPAHCWIVSRGRRATIVPLEERFPA